MEVRETACPGCTGDPAAPTDSYRVVLWEQPDLEGVAPERIGWGEVAFDLTDVTDVRDAIRWAEDQLASGAGGHSRAGRPVRDREYVVYAKVPGEDQLIQVAGWNPTVSAPAAPPFNLPRRPHSPSV